MTDSAQGKFSYFPPERLSIWPTDYFLAASKILPIVQRNWRQEAVYMLLLFAVIFIFYAITTPHTVSLEDDGLFISNLHFWGVAHPPGYPAHTFIGGIFYHLLPFGSAAYKAHLFSGFAGAGAAVALYAVVAMLLQGRLFPTLAAVAYASSKTFWAQAIIAEVYTLNACVFFTLLALGIYYAGQRKPSVRLLMIMAAVTGIGLANHYPLLLLGGVGIAMLALPRMPNKYIMAPLAAVVSVASALPFYLWMVWRSHQEIVSNFYGEPLDTLEKFWYYLLRKGYSTVDKQTGVDWSDKLQFTEKFSIDLLWQFTPLGIVFVIIGFLVMARSRYNWLWLCLLVSFLGGSAVLLILLDFQAGYIAFAVFRVYYLLSYGILAIWLALGAAWCIDLLRNYPILWRRLAGGALVGVISATIIITHWQTNNRSDYTWAEDLVNARLASVESNAVLFIHDDLDVPVMYAHYVKGVRPDLTVYSDQGLILPNRLFPPLTPEYPPPHSPQTPSRAAYIQQFIATEPSPIYYNSTRYRIFRTPAAGSDFLGFYRRVNRTSPQDRVIMHQSVKQWLQENLSGDIVLHDPWTKFQQYETISSVMNAVVQSAEEGTLELTDEWRDIIRIAREKNAKVRILTNFIRMDSMSEQERLAEAEWLADFNLDDEILMDKFGRGRFYILQSELAEKNLGKDNPLYEESLKLAIVEDERLNNPAVNRLLDFYSEEKATHCDYMNLINHYYPDINLIPPARLTQLRQIRKSALC